mmetsp:Transcript_45953/g.132519  ORF Transcript_45953/g.132519 Transcript_45953/m.132519 type:complete len:250 (-) Transcript_45953:1570-2319(-)
MRWLLSTRSLTSRCRRNQSRPPEDFAAGFSRSYFSKRRVFALAMLRTSLIARVSGGKTESSRIRPANVPSLVVGHQRIMSSSKCNTNSPPATTCSPRDTKCCATSFLKSSMSPTGLPSSLKEGMSIRRSHREATRVKAAWLSRLLSETSKCFKFGSDSNVSTSVATRSPSKAQSERSNMRTLEPAKPMSSITSSVTELPAPTNSKTESGGPYLSNVSKKPSNSNKPGYMRRFLTFSKLICAAKRSAMLG